MMEDVYYIFIGDNYATLVCSFTETLKNIYTNLRKIKNCRVNCKLLAMNRTSPAFPAHVGRGLY